MLKKLALATRIKDQLGEETKACSEQGKQVPLAMFQEMIGKNLGNSALQTLATNIGKSLNFVKKKTKQKRDSFVDDGLSGGSSDDSTKNLKLENFQKKRGEFIEALNSMITNSKKITIDTASTKKEKGKAKNDTLKAIAF